MKNLILLIALTLAPTLLFGQISYSFTADSNVIKEHFEKLKVQKTAKNKCHVESRFKNTKIEYLKTRYNYICDSTNNNIKNTIKSEFNGTDIFEEEISIALSCPNPFIYNDSRFVQNPNLAWQLNLVELPCAWSITNGDPNVIIGIADTDFQGDHPDFIDKFITIGGPITLQNFHGTLVAGMASPATNNGIGNAGAGFNCRMDGQRVVHFACGNNICGSPRDAINRCFNNGDRIINVSWTSMGMTEAEAQAFVDAGAVFTVGAGNEPTATGHNIVGNIQGVILVSAVDQNNNATTWTARNQFIDICAPGGSVNTLGTQSTYWDGANGTSFAAPLVAGVIGLMRSYNPCLTPQQIHQIITSTADPISNAS